jgi:hypothetical protein
MQKFYRFLKKILLFLSIAIILWFCVYFLYGDRISLTFTDRTFASYFPQILVFLTAASIYGLFILGIKSRRKKWGNLLLFFCGLILALLPFIAYHGYFQYQCGFWNEDLKKSSVLFQSEVDLNEKIQIIETKCKTQTEIKTDTIHIKQITPYFDLINDVKMYPSEKSNWVKGK